MNATRNRRRDCRKIDEEFFNKRPLYYKERLLDDVPTMLPVLDDNVNKATYNGQTIRDMREKAK